LARVGGARHRQLEIESTVGTLAQRVPIADVVKKQIAQRRRLFFKVCLRCGTRNPLAASRCRKCRSEDLRLKNRALGVKK
jgi:large subunit ribosomal protein L40e